MNWTAFFWWLALIGSLRLVLIRDSRSYESAGVNATLRAIGIASAAILMANSGFGTP